MDKICACDAVSDIANRDAPRSLSGKLSYASANLAKNLPLYVLKAFCGRVCYL